MTFDPDSIDSTVTDKTWDTVAQWLSEQDDYAATNCCPWCEFVGNASVLTEGARLKNAVVLWSLLSRSPFSDTLRAWAPPGVLT